MRGGLIASLVQISFTGVIPIQIYIQVLAPIFEELYPLLNESSVANFHASINLLGQNVLTALDPYYKVVSQNMFDTGLSNPTVSANSIPQGQFLSSIDQTGKNHVGYQGIAKVTNKDLILANDIIVQINTSPSAVLLAGQLDDQERITCVGKLMSL
ncbi:MAG: hypothetical protein EZS28_024861 [Streblomastix strix]|uniref:Uncharacterized protein n=1 Tax=Streblomastix strix TaxID=222440 RepID=A0A5J4VB30_9EUKA|nr:MAG: hypothetical protein EZS28_024861 [Streblomastix strix]